VRTASLWAGLLGIEGTTVKAVELDPEGSLTISVRLRRRQQRCGVCHRPCPGYDQGEGIRRWRVLDLGATPAYLEAAAPRVRCRQHGVVVAAVPWAWHGSRFSRTFEDQVAWLVTGGGPLQADGSVHAHPAPGPRSRRLAAGGCSQPTRRR
jgi:transposase